MRGIALLTACLLLAPATALATDTDDQLECWAGAALGSGGWANAVLADLTTGVGAGPPVGVHSQGWDFSASADDEIHCTWTVPDDYDGSGSIEWGGWLTSSDFCGGACANDGTISWQVGYRTYSDGDRVQGGWTTGGGLYIISTEVCAATGSVEGYCADMYHDFTASLSPSADPGDIVFFLIRRLAGTDTSDTVNAEVHVTRAPRWDY